MGEISKNDENKGETLN